MQDDYLFKVKILKDIEDIKEGSVIYVEKEFKNHYTGMWVSMCGSYNVKIPKDKCKKLDDLE